MSGQAQGWVHRYGPHPDHIDRDGRRYGNRARGLRSVLLVVADAANADGGHAHPGVNNVAEFALYSRRQTMTLLAELVAEGWLVVEDHGGGRGNATTYRLGERVQPPPGPGKGAIRDPERVQSETAKGAVCSETVQPRLHPNGLTTELPTELPNARLDGFDAFWEVYPRRTAKGAARKAWPAAVKAAGGWTRIVAGARDYAEWCALTSAEAKFIPHPATWLRAERWADELPAPPRRPGARAMDGDREGPEGVIHL